MQFSALISQLALPLGLAFIMFAMGLTLRFSDFRRVFLKPAALLLGLGVQIVLLPLVAFALLQVWTVSAVLMGGIMILAASPGGITSSLLTHLAAGDTALSVAMTALSSLLGMISVPLIVGLSLAWFSPSGAGENLSVAAMMTGVFLVSTLPVLAGIMVHQLWPVAAQRLEKIVRPLSVGIFVLIVLGAFASSWRIMMDNIAIIGPFMLALNMMIMGAGWGLARLAGLARGQAIAISLEGGLQNGALAIFVALTLLQDPALMIPGITYALVMNLTAAMVIVWRLRNGSRQIAASED